MSYGTNPRSVNDWDRHMPKEDDFGKIGHAEKRWAEGHFVDLYANPWVYTSTMTGNETFEDPSFPLCLYILDPNGSDRNFNPSGTFRAGFMAIVKNTDRLGSYIIFDSNNRSLLIGPGETSIIPYDGSTWL